jgi:hypothetical protein
MPAKRRHLQSMHHEEMQVKFEYSCCPIIIGEIIVIGLENFLKMTVSVHFLSDGWMDSKDVWYADVS